MALALLFSAWLATTTPSAPASPRPGDARVGRDPASLACGLASVIAAVHAVPPPTRGKVRDRFVILATDNAQAYVQCLFQDHDSWMLCEASSGRYAPSYLTLSPEQRQQIAIQGLDTLQTKGAFQRAVKTPYPGSFRSVADLMVATSLTTYVTAADRSFEVYAPLLGDDTQAIMDRSCSLPAVSS